MNSRSGSSYTVTPFDAGQVAAPDLTALARANPTRYPFLLESVAAGPELARYDILFAFPGATLELRPDGTLTGSGIAVGSFLAALDDWWAQEAEPAAVTDELPFRGGWFLFLGYELAEEVEPSLRLSRDARLPVAFATRVPVAVIADRLAGSVKLADPSSSTGTVPSIRSSVNVPP